MADAKITALTADTSPTTDDLVVTVNDPGGTPANKKVTLAAILALGGMVRAGGSTSESTTTSTTPVDIVTISGLSIAAGVPILVRFDFRATNGATPRTFGFGIKLNSTVIFEADNTARNVAASGGSGHASISLGGREATHIKGNWHSEGGFSDANGYSGSSPFGGSAATADMPTATITSISIRGCATNADTTTAVKNIHIYTLATS